MKLELDLYWITKGKQDPLAYFAKYPGRFPMVHVKDMTGNGAMMNVGQGHIDWPTIFAKRREAGIEHFFVEHDKPKSPLEDIKASYDVSVEVGTMNDRESGTGEREQGTDGSELRAANSDRAARNATWLSRRGHRYSGWSSRFRFPVPGSRFPLRPA